MKAIRAYVAVLLFVPLRVSAQVHVRGYTRSDGTYVHSYDRSYPHSHADGGAHVGLYVGGGASRDIYGYPQYVAPVPQVMPPAAPKPPRNLTPDDLPKSSFSGDTYDDRDPLLKYQKDQAEKGNPQSQFAMGVRYLTGTGVEKNEAKGREMLEAASKNGNLQARQKLRELDDAKKKAALANAAK